MKLQKIVLGILLFSFVGNVFFKNKVSFETSSNYNITEISYSNLNSLKNISKIDVYLEKAYIFTETNLQVTNFSASRNLSVPEYYYNIGNKDLFTSYIKDNKEIDIYYKKNEVNKLFSILSALPNIIFIFLLVRILMMQANQFSGFNKRIELKNDVDIKFKDIAGLQEVKEEVREFVDLLNGDDKFKEMGCKVPRGALFYGSPGTGKTLIAKAVAGECSSSFIHVSGSGFNEVYVGVGQSRVRKLFENARKNKPCVIFIDEIDALGAKRGYNSSHSENENTLNSLLSEMDGVEDNSGILIFGATNRPEMLDSALMRPGRFDRKIQFNLPTLLERNEIFNLYLNKYKLDGDVKDLSKSMSRKCLGLSGADISNLCNEAAILAVRNKRNTISQNDLDDAFDYIAVGQKRLSNKLSESDKRCVAFHECGHAFMSYVQKHAESPIKVSIIPTTKGALGYSMSLEKEENLKTSKQLYQQMAVMLGGRCSEELFMEDVTTGASNDLMKLRESCKRYITEYGFTEKFKNNYINENMENISEMTKHDIDDKIQNLIDEVTNYTLKTLKENKSKVKTMANILYKKEELNNKEIEKILGRKIESTL